MPKKTTIVLADEQTLFREGLAVICENTRQFRVVGHCGDGRSAVKMIEALAPDIAILDLGLPKLYALAVDPAIAFAGSASPKILVLSMRRERKTVLDVLRSGANGYLLKNDPVACLLDGLRDDPGRQHLCLAAVQAAGDLRPQGEGPAAQRPSSNLPAREHQVFMLLVQGLSGKEIADRLELSQKTVSTYRSQSDEQAGHL